MKRTVFGVIWFVVIYFGLCVLIGAVAGGIAGANNPENANEAGAIAGAAAVAKYRIYIIIFAIITSVAGTVTRFLPGTRVKASDGGKAT